MWLWEKWINQSAFTVRDTLCMYLIAFINNTGRVQSAKFWYALCCVCMHSTKSLPYHWPWKPLKCVTVMCIQKELRNQLERHKRCSYNNKTQQTVSCNCYVQDSGHCTKPRFDFLYSINRPKVDRFVLSWIMQGTRLRDFALFKVKKGQLWDLHMVDQAKLR